MATTALSGAAAVSILLATSIVACEPVWLSGRAGEARMCGGCHENRTAAAIQPGIIGTAPQTALGRSAVGADAVWTRAALQLVMTDAPTSDRTILRAHRVDDAALRDAIVRYLGSDD